MAGGHVSPRRSLAFDRQSQFGSQSFIGSGNQLGQTGSMYGNQQGGTQSPTNSGFFGAHERSASNLGFDDFGSQAGSRAFGTAPRSMSPGPRMFGTLPADYIIIGDIQTSSCCSFFPCLTRVLTLSRF